MQSLLLDAVVERSLLKNYEPQFTGTSETFPSSIEVPSFLQHRVAVEDASRFLLQPHIRFGLGIVRSVGLELLTFVVLSNILVD